MSAEAPLDAKTRPRHSPAPSSATTGPRGRRGEPGFREQFDDLRHRFRRERRRWPDQDSRIGDASWARFVISLHGSAVQALEPDLIILDEFQRFKHLLQADEPAGELAQQLFTFEDHRGNRRGSFCSRRPRTRCTPSPRTSRTTTTATSSDTLRFLFGDEDETASIRARSPTRTAKPSCTSTPRIWGELSSEDQRSRSKLRRVMVRTERLSTTPDRNGMLVERRPEGLVLEAAELDSFAAVDVLARQLDAGDVLEYWKSAPYLLSFMDEYKLIRELARAAEAGDRRHFADLVRGQHVLRWAEIERFKGVDAENPRLRSLMAEVLDNRGLAAVVDSSVAAVLRARPAVRRGATAWLLQAAGLFGLGSRAESHSRPREL